MRALLWFAAGVSAVLAALVAAYVWLIHIALAAWDQEEADADYSRYSTPEQLQARIEFTTERIWHGTYGDRAL